MSNLASFDSIAFPVTSPVGVPFACRSNATPVASLGPRLLGTLSEEELAQAFTSLDRVVKAATTHPRFLNCVAGLLRQFGDAHRSILIKALRGAGPAHGLGKGEAEQQGMMLVAALRTLQDLKQRSQLTSVRHSAYVLPAGTPMERLHARRILRVETVTRAVFRKATHGTSCTVRLTDDPAAVGFTVRTGQVYPYCGRYKTISAIRLFWTVTVPQRWLSRVDRRGLAVVGGLLTLDAQPLRSPVAGVELYAAVWAAQTRGLDVRVERGVIARQGATSYHGSDVARAIAGLRRKMSQEERWALSPDERADRRLQCLVTFARRFGDEPVTLDDSAAVGNCPYGTRSWCYGVGIDPDATATTLARVLEGYRQRPQDDAWAVVMRVVQRGRSR
ncbi:MAG: hypothetical protein ACLGJC_23550 [Alphaproteobacteria bacterium]